ncbi:hypothetical protein EMCRGX_G019237 [Ephydatia muelleri]
MVPSLVPVVTTSSYGNSIAGSVYTLVCMVKVVDGLVVVPDVVWMKDGGVLVNGTNIILTRTVSGGNSTLNLTFNPLLTSHGGQYTCVATISVPQLSLNITNSSAVTVSVQTLPPPVVTTSSYGSTIAGSVYSLVCMVKVVDGLVVNPDVVWMKDGGVLVNGTNTTLTRTVLGGNSNLNLIFNPLLTSHGGQYICVATISVPQLSLSVTNSSAVTVSVQIPVPSVTLSPVPLGSSVYTGTSISMSCAFTVPSVVDSPVMLNTLWTGPQGPIYNGKRTMTTITQSMMVYNATLQINPSNASDTGIYWCVGNISSNSSYIVTSSNASANTSLTVQALPPPVVTTSSYGSTIAGSVYSLVCMVKVVDGLVVVPDVVWMKDGGVLVNGTNTTLTRTVLGGNSTLNLTFNRLLTSHGGQYTCVATISVPQLSLNVTNSSAATVSVQIPLPSATIVSVSPGSLVVSGIPISIFCAFSIPSVVETSVMVKTFWIRLNQTLNNGDRIKISTSQSMVAYNTTLQITPVNISDTGMYQCVGSISSNSSYVVGSSNASANISLSVQALPPPVVTTSSYGSTIAGSVYSLVCMVKVVDGLVVVPDVVWMKDGGALVNGTNTTLTRTVSGQYICVATISVPQLSLNITHLSAATVSVQIPVPSVTLSPVPLGSSVYTGTSISMSCAFTVPSVVDSPVMLNTLWTGPQGPIYNGKRTMTTITQSMMVYNATLQINPSNTSDTGIYWCVGNISSNSSYIVTSSNASANTSLTVQALPPPVVTTSSYGNSIAGSVYSLVCMVKVVDGLVVVPDVVWMKDGGVLVNGTNTTLTRTVLGGNSNLNLTFNPLLTSHGGQYTCVGTMFVPQLSLNVTNSSAAPVSVQIPLPSATIVFVSPGSLVVSGIPIGIFCTFSIPSVVDTSIMVKTFWIRLNQTLNNGDRIKISTSQSMVAYNTTLQITPVNISDTGMYQCVGSISSNSSYVVGSSNASANISLSVQALPPPLVTTSSYGSTIAGSVYSLVCTVKVIDGLVVVPDVMWMKDGRVIVNGTNTTLTRTVSGGNSTINLTFNPLLTSHGGQYICVAAISVPQLSLSVTNSSTVTVSVQIPVPSVTLSPVPLGSSVYTGTSISMSCAFTVPSVVDSPVMLNTLWIGPQGPIYIGNRTMATITQSMMVYTATLQINPSNTSDTGIYWCVGNISSNSSYIVTSSNASANASLTVQALPPPVVTTSSYGNSIAGSVYSLVCMVKVVDGLVVVPDVVWMKDGGVLVNGTNTTLTRTVLGGNSNLNLTFNPLLTSHGGQYTCVATMSVPQLSLNVTNSSAAPVSVQIPLPSATIVFVSPGSLVVSGIPIGIFCTFSIPSVVDTSIMVKTFWIRLNQTLNNGDRIKISTSQSMVAYNTTLQITPVNISDTGMYQCVGSISSNSSYVVGSSNASANISLSVQALPPPLVTTSSYGSTIAGSVYSLVCTVKVIDGLVVVPDVMWMKDGRVIVNGTNTTLTRTVSGGNSTLNLTFNPLLTSHGGQYICVAAISVPQLSLSVTNSSTVTVSVQIPVPNVTLSPVPLGSSVYTGTSISMSCAFTVPSVVDFPVMLNTLWIGPQGPIYIGNRTMATITQSMMVYIATLQINPSNTSDTGIYWCVGNISSNSSYIVTSSNASANASLTVQALPPPVVTTSSYGSTIAGSVYSLVCMVKVVDGLVVVPDVVWMKDGGVLVNGTNTTLTRTVLGGNSNLNLTFNPLLTSHGGQYTCVATISVPQLSLNVTNSSAAPVSVQIPLPSATIVFVSPGSLVVSGIPIGIFCTFSIPSVVDTSVMVKTFWIRLNQTLNNGDRIKISTSQSMVAYNTTLQITPVNISDTGMYQCVGSISSNSSYVVGSSNASANISLSVQALPPPLVTTSSYGSTIVGSVYSLVCMVKVVDGLVVNPDVVWMKDGGALVNGTNTTLTRTVSGGNSTLNLTFSPLLTSQGGQYTCVATISVPQLSLSVTNSSAVTVSVQIPVPRVTLSPVPLGSSVYTGTSISMSCAFTVPSVVDSPVMLNTLWIGPQGPIYNGNRTMATITQSMMVYNATLQINPSNASDTGIYWCVGNISSNSSYIVTSSNASANTSLTVQALPPPVVTTSSYGSTIAGLVYSLQCMVKVVDGLVVVPDVVWMKDGGVLVNGTNTTLTRTMSGGNSTLNLTFNPLLTSHGGQYTCVATISIPQLSLSITNSDVSVLNDSAQYICVANISLPYKDNYISSSAISEICLIAPDSVRGAKIDIVSDTNVFALWSSPWKTNGILRGYRVTCTVLEDYNKPWYVKYDSNLITTSMNITSLAAGIPYELCISAHNSAGSGPEWCNVFFTDTLPPTEAPQGVVVTRSSDGLSMTVRWSPVTLMKARGFPFYAVSYTSNDAVRIRQAEQIIVYDAAFVSITELSPLADYSVSVTVLNHGNKSGMSTSETDRMTSLAVISQSMSYTLIFYGAVAAISCIVLVVVLVLCCCCACCCYCCCKLKPKRYEIYELNQPERGVSRLKENMSTTDMAELDSIRHKGVHPDRRVPISLSCFRDHVEKMRGDENNGFQLEFECLKSEPDKSDHIDSSQLPCNQVKNRFCNILPYDASRVKLKELNDIPGSDYINASYIDGYNCQKIYIAAQGPTDETVNDFWRMVWEKRLGTIVMLTRCIESGTEKCAQYWASTNGNHETARFKVTTISASQFADYTITSLVVSDKEKSEDELLHVKHFHFTSWPDHGVPDTPSSLVTFIKYVQKNCKFTEESPLLVHCSAGVGRSGTFIALHILLERIKTEDSINVFECVNQMRKRRPFMVQSLDQYVYIHDAILEQIMCGDTEIDAGNFRVKVNNMYKVAAGNGTNGFVQQFQLLNDVCNKSPKEDCSVSLESCNEVKNRYKNKPHYNHTQIRLAQDSTNSTYINASRIQGYKLSCMYIATQGPLSNTVNDFWKMIMEQECKTIVMLCELMEEGEESCACYWPTAERPVNFGTLSIHLLSVIIRNGIIFRNFKLTENTNELLVAQYCYSEWPQHGKPASLPNLLTLLDTLNKALSASERNVITVVCNDGCGRTGSFICIHSELERLKAEGVVNIFQSVKAMRSYRPGMVQDVILEVHKLVSGAAVHLVGRMVPPTPSPTPTRDHVLELEVVGMCLLALLPNTPLLEPNDHCLHCCREQITSWYASQCLLSSSLSEVTRNFSKVTIRWEKVPCVDQNSVIVGYRVLYGAVTSGVGWAIYSSGMT